MQFIFNNKIKAVLAVLMLLGVVSSVFAFLDHASHGQRFWSNFLIDGFFVFSLGLGALFFLALQYATEAAWSVLLKRVFEATALFIPVGAVLIIIALLSGTLHLSHTYHWMLEGIMQKGHENYDAIIASKAGYLNQPFFWLRTLVYLGTFIAFVYIFRKRSLLEEVASYKGSVKLSAIFLVLFGVFSSTLSWDWIMSIDTHWFSTLFGWYVFAGFWCSALIFMLVLTVALKMQGLLPNVNDSHIHDLSKWVFALSFLWSYVWFAQFMLIWYSDIPEEVTYYQERFGHYKILMLGVFAVNFILPMILLMSRDAKRNYTRIIWVSSIIFVGHWLDVFLMITPGTLHEKGQVSFVEIGMFLGFVALFLWVVLQNLSKAPLEIQNHPFKEESEHHHF